MSSRTATEGVPSLLVRLGADLPDHPNVTAWDEHPFFTPGGRAQFGELLRRRRRRREFVPLVPVTWFQDR